MGRFWLVAAVVMFVIVAVGVVVSR